MAMRTYLYEAGTIVMLLTILLTGCGNEKNVDYNIDGVTEETRTENNNGKKSVSQFADEENWNEVWTVDEGVEDPVEITIDAEVTIPEAEEMSVVEVRVPEFDVKFKEHAVKTLFEGNDVYYNDLEHLPKKELEELYMENKEWYESATTEMERETARKHMQEYEKLLENASDTYTLADSYEVDEYIGEVNGITYELWVSDFYGETGWDINAQWFNFYAANIEEICPDEYEGYTHYMEHRYMTCDRYTNVGENECDISIEDAEKVARDLLKELGLEYPVLAYTKPLIWGDSTLSDENMYDWPANGYAFTFEYGVDEVSFTGLGTNYDYVNLVNSEADEVPQYSMMATASVYVTEKGVIDLHAYSPVETVDISESVELLPLDTIKEIMKEKITTEYEDFRFINLMAANELTFDHMELIYFRVRDTGNSKQYSYVPAWRLTSQIGDAVQNNLSIRNPVVINAIDGTLINVYDEM